jgi:mucolipin 3
MERQTHVIFVSESNITFHHLFVRGWSSSDETLPYPRASGDFAVYTDDDFHQSINYAIRRVDKEMKSSVLSYGFLFI